MKEDRAVLDAFRMQLRHYFEKGIDEIDQCGIRQTHPGGHTPASN